MGACHACYAPVLRMGPEVRYIDIWGGRGRGGSYFVTDYFLDCLLKPEYFRGYFMRAVFRDIRESLWQDFKDRISEREELGTLDPALIHLNEVAMVATCITNGNSIKSRGFKKSSKGQTAKLKSIAGATAVAIEECEEVEEPDFMQLDDSLRTAKSPIRIFRVFNPPKKNHWLLANYYNLTESKQKGYYIATPKRLPGFLSIFSRYYDNLTNLNETTVQNFESYRIRKPEYYWTTIRGLVSEGAKGRIYSGWQPITMAEFDAIDAPVFYGLDFGYSDDPLALVACKRHNGRLWIKPLLYEPGLTDPKTAEKFERLGIDRRTPIYADSGDPKTIETLRQFGFNVIGAWKGPGSIKWGIKQVKDFDVSYVESSIDFGFEYQEYRWAFDQSGNPTDEPEDKNNHYMDAIRYAIAGSSGRLVGTATPHRIPTKVGRFGKNNL